MNIKNLFVECILLEWLDCRLVISLLLNEINYIVSIMLGNIIKFFYNIICVIFLFYVKCLN